LFFVVGGDGGDDGLDDPEHDHDDAEEDLDGGVGVAVAGEDVGDVSHESVVG
jgi:hypothetical protein